MNSHSADTAKQINVTPDELSCRGTGCDLSRTILLGPRASGKSTVAARLARDFDLAHVEFDTINRNKDRSPVSDSDYTKVLTELVQQPRWVVDGDYLEGIDRLALPIVWPLATTLIWLDLPFMVTVRRLVSRTHRRIVHKEKAWGDMQDSKSSLLKRLASANVVRAYWGARRAYPVLLKKPEHRHLSFIHLRTEVEVDNFLRSIDEISGHR